MTTITVKDAYHHCQEVTRASAKNFYYAFITLPKPRRQAIYAAYAFARICDDIADDQLPLAEKVERLAGVRRTLAEAYRGRVSGEVFTALMDAVHTYDIPEEFLQEIINGVEMDLTVMRYQDFAALKQYCYRVASVVGLVCTRIFGGRDPAREDPLAIDLGMAMQLTNIMRDVPEDAARGRIYLPLDELARFGYTERELMAGMYTPAFVEMMRFEAQRARAYFASGARLVPLLPARSRACPLVLGGLYSRILERIEERNYNVFAGRVSLSSREKLALALGLWVRSLLPQRAAAS
jgi:phytoene synthase